MPSALAPHTLPPTRAPRRGKPPLALYLRLVLGAIGAVLVLTAEPPPPALGPMTTSATTGGGQRRVRRAARRALLRPKRNPTDQDILEQAQAAYIRGERQLAIDLATSVAEKGGSLAEPAWRFIGLAACSVRAARLATRAYGNLAEADDQQDLIRACQMNGLAFASNQFVER
jgi:hypothetical protein